jgi:hypothetical protein
MDLLVSTPHALPPPPPPPIKTLYRGDNGHMVKEVARFCLPDGALVADGKGVFWSHTDVSRFTLLGSDLAVPRIATAARATRLLPLPGLPLGQPLFLVADFTALPYRLQCLDALFLDPPYMHQSGDFDNDDFYGNATSNVGMTHQDILREYYCAGMLEAAKVLKPGGRLFVKGKEQIESRKQCWTRHQLPLAAARCGFSEVEEFIFEATAGPGQFARKVGHTQHYAQKNHSTMFYFALTDPPVRLTRGRPRKESAGTILNGDRGKDYLRARLVWDHPAIYARYMAGELPSVHAAAKEAGLVKARRSAVPATP